MFETVASTYYLPIVIAVIMFNLGLGLRLEDFRYIFLYPKAFFVGLFSQMVLLPAVAFGIALISGLSPELKTGIIIIAACPGGAVSNLITYYLKGNVPLSISLTSVNSFLILFTIPALVYLGMEVFLEESEQINLPVAYMVGRIFLMILVPVAVGMFVRWRNEKRAENIEQYLKYIMLVLLAGVYSLVIFQKNDGSITTFAQYLKIIPYVFALNVIGMFLGYWLARISNCNLAKQITLSVEIGIQNSALAITIASAFLGSHTIALPAVIYGAFTFFNAVIFGLIIRKWLRN